MANKYYAVKQGRKTGVFTSWDECKRAVEKFPNAVYKSFTDYNEAYDFVFKEDKILNDKEVNVVAYIDGSYDDSKKAFSYAGIILNNGEKIEFSDVNNNEELVELRNVAGELFAAMYVMKYAKANNIMDIIIYYDYAGIEMWATKKWKANLKLTQEYVVFSQEIMKDINIIFHKVKAHSGVEYNEQVDKLAKIALQKFNVKNNKKIETVISNDVFSKIKGSKTLTQINILIDNSIITSEDLMIILKNKWKKKGRKIKEIKNIKSYYDIIKNRFVVMVITELDENIIVIEGSEFDGKK